MAFLKVLKTELAHDALHIISNGGWNREELLNSFNRETDWKAAIGAVLKQVFSFIQ